MRWLGPAVALLLFAQWPLREGLGAWSIEANDLAQWLFALYVAAAVPHAGRRSLHVVARPDLAARGGRWRAGAPALGTLAWATYLLATSAPTVLRSVLAAERFPESMSPGYFMVKVALLLLAALMTLQAAGALRAALRPRAG